jgi:hypothetical protein
VNFPLGHLEHLLFTNISPGSQLVVGTLVGKGVGKLVGCDGAGVGV